MDSFWYASFKVFLSDGMQKEGEVYKSNDRRFVSSDFHEKIHGSQDVNAELAYLNKGARVEKV